MASSDVPGFQYFLSRADIPVTEDSEIWGESLPLAKTRSDERFEDAGRVRYGDYFSAVRSFLEKDRFRPARTFLSSYHGREVAPGDIREFRVFLEKHGAFYHPARIEIDAEGKTARCVLNVAVSDTGRGFVDREYESLQGLNAARPISFIPRVYALGESPEDAGPRGPVRMFLAQWFEGYHEFHQCVDPVDGRTRIAVWDTDRGRIFLSSGQALALYACAAKILTWYYDLESFEQIRSWHHAAGDFIVRVEGNKLDLKLISVRRYATMFEEEREGGETDGDAALTLEALLIFLVNLSIRMRLDRLDGTGTLAWSDDAAVCGSVDGFLQAMLLKCRYGMVSESGAALLRAYLLACSEESLHELAEAIVATHYRVSPDRPVVDQNLRGHIALLHQAIQDRVPRP